MGTTSNMSRIRYPNRTVYFGVQSGLVDPKVEAERVERARLKRLAQYMSVVGKYLSIPNDMVVVTPIADFKKEFGICGETS